MPAKRKRNWFERKMREWRDNAFRDLNRPLRRFVAWCDMLVLDHGFIRLAYSNRYAIGAKLERSSHPSPWQIAGAAKRGIKTIVNLRGANEIGSCRLEQWACAMHGIALVDFRLKSRQLPTAQKILDAREIFTQITYPALIHCKSGADRAGLMAALYCIFQLNEPVEQAKKQLSLKYGHISASKTGVLDFLFTSFLASGENSFLFWVENSYDPKVLEKHFRCNGWVSWFVDKVLRRE